jgi:hypothetical protein
MITIKRYIRFLQKPAELLTQTSKIKSLDIFTTLFKPNENKSCFPTLHPTFYNRLMGFLLNQFLFVSDLFRHSIW